MKIFWKLLLLSASLIVVSCASTASASNIDEEESVEMSDEETQNFIIALYREVTTKPTYFSEMKEFLEETTIIEEFYCFNESTKTTIMPIAAPNLSETSEVFYPESFAIAYQRPYDGWASESGQSWLFISDPSATAQQWLALGVYWPGDTSKFYQIWSKEHDFPGISETTWPHTDAGEPCLQAELNKYYSEVKVLGCFTGRDEKESGVFRHERLTDRFIVTEVEYQTVEGIELLKRSEHLGKCVLSE
ncbi:MAG: hypothetical protein CMQ75_04450 [Gammaproteobacteria bacterium]|nr:hypothetical protein [Gammaproteobacteria bacterium]|tara:strand:- start:53 stop:793 length:741 start_codon:yes stop_codon:yes gene_type:complete